MSIYYVLQNQTYKQERQGGYVWAPQTNQGGKQNAGYKMMTELKQGDFILHHCKRKLMAISVAKNDCYESNQPNELVTAEKDIEWDEAGYRVDVEYYDFEPQLNMKDLEAWLRENHIQGSAFTKFGTGKEQYMCALADEHAKYILERLIELQENEEVLKILRLALDEIANIAN